MISLVKLATPLAVGCLLAVSGCGDDGGGGDPADAMTIVTPDAMLPQIDAMNVANEALGTTCTPANPTECVAEAPTCVNQQGATNGFCTLPCGTSPDPGTGNQPTPPAGGDTTCAAAYTGTGTAACVVYIGTIGGGADLEWMCGILCGDFMGTPLGTCESNLTCSANNFCEP